MFRKSIQPNNSVDTSTVLAFIEKLNTTFQGTAKSSNIDQTLQALLAEYNALRSEILSRSGAQNTILQIHITAITLILGGVLSGSFGQWLIFLIPIEATFFGLWWLDHSLVIMEIGTYIRESIEPKVSKLLNQESLMFWETNLKAGFVASDRKRRTITFNMLVFITFAGPAIISLLYSLILIFLTTLVEHNFLSSNLVLQIKPIYPGISLWLAVSCLMINIVFFFAYISMYFYRIQAYFMTKTK